MDLYIQIGVLLLFLAAFSLFVYFYTQPAQLFSDGIQETNAQISQQVADIKDNSLREAHYNPNLPASKLINIIESAESKQIAVLVQTRNAMGLVANYGPQLRPVDFKGIAMNPAGVDKNTPPYSNFDLFYVTTVQEVFYGKLPITATNQKVYGEAAFPPSDLQTMNDSVGAEPNLNPVGSATYLRAKGGTAYTTFKLTHFTTSKSITGAVKSGETLSLSGSFYTDNVLINASNNNFSYMKNKSSGFYISKNSSFYTTTILDSNNEIVAIYAEEHGTDTKGSVLSYNMYLSNAISSY